MVLGMSVFGIPLGLGFGLSIGNFGMLAIGIGIGMAIGVGVGTSMDKKAFNEGRQLDFEAKWFILLKTEPLTSVWQYGG